MEEIKKQLEMLTSKLETHKQKDGEIHFSYCVFNDIWECNYYGYVHTPFVLHNRSFEKLLLQVENKLIQMNGCEIK